MNGEIIIGTKLDNSGLKKGLAEEKRRLQKYGNEAEKLTKIKQQYETDLKGYDEEEKNIKRIEEDVKRLNAKYKEIKETRKKLFDEGLSPEEVYAKAPETTPGNLENALKERQKAMQELLDAQRRRNQLLSSEDAEKTRRALEDINKQLDENVKKQNETKNNIEIINAQLQKTETLKDIKSNIDKIGTSITRVVKKVIRWGLAIFGIRSAYMLVRSAMSTISQYDTQLKADIDYMKNAVAFALEPVVRKIVEWMKMLMFYVAYIIKMWTGKDIFKNANKSLQSANKSAKELRKTLAGFDEMNILNDNVNGEGSGASTPSFDLTDVYGFKVPKWLEWIAKNKNIVLGFFTTLGALLVASKIAPYLAGLGSIAGIIAVITTGIIGLIKTITGVIDFIKDPSWENFNKILDGLTYTVLALAGAFILLAGASPVGWILLAVGAVLTFVTAISKLINKLTTNKAKILEVKEAEKQLEQARRDLKQVTSEYVSAIDNAEEAEKKLKDAQDRTGLSGEALFKLIQDGTLDYKDMTDAQKEVYKAYIENLDAQDRLKESTEKLNEAKKEEIKKSLEAQLSNAKEKDSYDELKTSVIKAFEEGKISANQARDYLSRAMAGMSDDSKRTFMSDIPNDIKAGLDPNRYESSWTRFKQWWNKNILGLSTTVEITGVAKGGGGRASFGGGGSGGRAKGGIYYPKLAVGGIINMPGRGLPYHGATIGERGAEAVVPLTDSQQMALLGEAIGKYININATIPVYVANRQIAKEIRRINAEDDFAFNR